ncbi:hypothetical protein IV203_017384 [Nitzschia inconspicua]|uniref:Uncharacterized protein n=1 Tax=Nitzschia inconspicua TaxID=303405 RepID=A0A9K3P862_9STRA|nr:hypothetical protein IV203_017571 [Nitzschia inconspicua]KAG7348679.1 hypothetical protein IV203_017384 [Nitzschia inconspicua]
MIVFGCLLFLGGPSSAFTTTTTTTTTANTRPIEWSSLLFSTTSIMNVNLDDDSTNSGSDGSSSSSNTTSLLLVQDKLSILQDVVKQLKQRQQRDAQAVMETTERTHSRTIQELQIQLEDSKRRHEEQLQLTNTEWETRFKQQLQQQRRHDQEELQRQRDNDANTAAAAAAAAANQWKIQQEDYVTQIKTLQDELRQVRQKEKEKAAVSYHEYQSQLSKLKEENLDYKTTIQQLTMDLDIKDKKLLEASYQLETMESKWKRQLKEAETIRRQQLQQQKEQLLKEFTAEKQQWETELDEVRSECQERVEIATAAVQAGKKREERFQRRLSMAEAEKTSSKRLLQFQIKLLTLAFQGSQNEINDLRRRLTQQQKQQQPERQQQQEQQDEQ